MEQSPPSIGALSDANWPAHASKPAVERFELYEVWISTNDRWELLGAFPELELANALAKARGRRVRLIHATYEDGKCTESEILAEIGSTRT